MKEIKDINGHIITVGDVIAMPHLIEPGYEDKILHGYYITKVHYDKELDRLVCDNGMGFKLAYGVVKINK